MRLLMRKFTGFQFVIKGKASRGIWEGGAGGLLLIYRHNFILGKEESPPASSHVINIMDSW
jgi:hypothetical protein